MLCDIMQFYHQMFYLLALIIKSDSKNKNSACTAELTSFVLRVARKLIMTIELQYYVNLKANFKGCVCYIFASLSCMSKREHF